VLVAVGVDFLMVPGALPQEGLALHWSDLTPPLACMRSFFGRGVVAWRHRQATGPTRTWPPY